MGECCEIAARIQSASVNLTVTSPPYDDLRTYNGSLNDWGRDKWCSVFEMIHRISVENGTLVWIVSDATINGGETGSSFKQVLDAMQIGWKLHDTMIWRKSNFSNPSTVRYHQVFEYMFVFVKGRPVFNPIKDRANIHAGEQGSRGTNTFTLRNGAKKTRPTKVNADFGMRHNVWDQNTSGQQRENHGHPAAFPRKLVEDHIISWSNPGDIVFDPFAGSGTTAVAAHNTGRRWICIERDPEYFYKAICRVTEECR
jgi:DNA modification methylase